MHSRSKAHVALMNKRTQSCPASGVRADRYAGSGIRTSEYTYFF